MDKMKQYKIIFLIGIVVGLCAISVLLLKKESSANVEKKVIDLLITDGTVLTMNSKQEIVEKGAVAISGEKIIAVGMADVIGHMYNAKETIDVHGAVVLPGLINAHTHAPMVFFRGLADDLPLIDWLEKYIFPAEKKHVTVEFVYWGTRLSCYEMIKSGVTTFVDMYFFEDAVAQAAYDIGMRAMVGQGVTGFPTPDSSNYKKALERAKNLVKKWKNNSLIIPAIAPHSCYTCSKEILLAVKEFSKTYGVPLLIHVAESDGEMKQVIQKWGMRPIDCLNSLGMLDNTMIAAHCVHVDDNEIALLKKNGVGVIHAPTSNMKLSSGVARIDDFLTQGVLVGLGTDGAASNNSLDMFAEMKTAALLQKIGTGKPTALNAYQTLELATIGGACAIHMDDQIGSLEVGKKADVTIVSMDKIHQIPVYNVVSQLVYATKATDVQTVIINGKIIMKDRVLGAKGCEDELREKVEYFRRQIKPFGNS